MCKIKLRSDSFADVRVPRFDFINADYNKINRKLSEINWNILIGCSDISSRVDHNIVSDVIENNVLLKRCSESSYPPWYSMDLKRLVIDKIRAHVK